MSHVLDIRSLPDAERLKCQIKRPDYFLEACRNMGFITLTDEEEQKERGVKYIPGRGRYVGHKSVYGSLVGDWPIPKGWKESDVDNNAHYIVRLSPAQLDELAKKGHWYKGSTPYELGLVWDEEDQCFYPVYDYADSGGSAMSAFIGRPKHTKERSKGKMETAYDAIMQAYQAICVQHAAEEQGHEIEWQKLEDGSMLAYAYLEEPKQYNYQEN